MGNLISSSEGSVSRKMATCLHVEGSAEENDVLECGGCGLLTEGREAYLFILLQGRHWAFLVGFRGRLNGEAQWAGIDAPARGLALPSAALSLRRDAPAQWVQTRTQVLSCGFPKAAPIPVFSWKVKGKLETPWGEGVIRAGLFLSLCLQRVWENIEGVLLGSKVEPRFLNLGRIW